MEVIAQVRGRVLHRGADEVVVEVGGVGLNIVVTSRTVATLTLGEETTLTTDLIVREDSLTLYGFADSSEREIFRTVQSVSGIGPRLAMTMLATLSADQIRTAIAAEDESVLMTVSGLGRKTAQRLIVDLKDRIGPVATVNPASAPASAPWRLQVHAALTGLGWTAAQAQSAVDTVAARPTAADLAVGEALKLALQVLDHTPSVSP